MEGDALNQPRDLLGRGSALRGRGMHGRGFIFPCSRRIHSLQTFFGKIALPLRHDEPENLMAFSMDEAKKGYLQLILIISALWNALWHSWIPLLAAFQAVSRAGSRISMFRTVLPRFKQKNFQVGLTQTSVVTFVVTLRSKAHTLIQPHTSCLGH
jgi:hypothetical protein